MENFEKIPEANTADSEKYTDTKRVPIKMMKGLADGNQIKNGDADENPIAAAFRKARKLLHEDE